MGDEVQKSKREERLREQLRANLARRKQQTRATRSGKGDKRKPGIAAASVTDNEAESND
ncbi:MAG: hypothetical protein AAGI92_07450 [Pseudomonadota bacterium]